MEIYEHHFEYPTVREVPRAALQPDHPLDTPPEPVEDYTIGIAEFSLALIGKGLSGNGILHLSDTQ